MKKIISLFFVFIFTLNLIICVNASQFPDYKDKYLNDFANIFSPNETAQLRNLFINIDESTTAEVVIVTVNSTLPYTPSEYRTQLFNYWHIGKKDKDNGLLILYSVTEKRLEVEVGYGLEGILPDSKVGRYLDLYYVPLRDKGDYKAGIISFTNEITKIIIENKEEVISGDSKNNSAGINNLLIISGVLVIIFIIIFIILTRKNNKLNNQNSTISSKNIINDDLKLNKIPNLKRSLIQNILLIPIVIIFLSIFILPFTFDYYPESYSLFIFLGQFISIFIILIVFSKIPYKCITCQNNMTYKKKIGDYQIYECKNGHLGKLYFTRTTSSRTGFGGGGFSGGGGFGGGGSGGGGAGR